MANPRAYQPLKQSRGEFRDIRGLRYQIRVWGNDGHTPLVLLHGGKDGSVTFQFVVDCLKRDWHIFAPDWRGHGLSAHASQGYWFPDYVADLDVLLEQLFPRQQVALVGHSLGGNAACIYAGLRPERVSRLISLDGFGLPDRTPNEAPAHLRQWLASWRGQLRAHKVYATVADMAARLIRANPRLSEAKALFLASNLSKCVEDGRFVWAFDPRHRDPFGMLHRKAEWAACLAEVKARTLFIGSGQPFPPALGEEPEGLAGRIRVIPGADFKRLEGTSHNLHHDEPETIAALIEEFLTAK